MSSFNEIYIRANNRRRMLKEGLADIKSPISYTDAVSELIDLCDAIEKGKIGLAATKKNMEFLTKCSQSKLFSDIVTTKDGITSAFENIIGLFYYSLLKALKDKDATNGNFRNLDPFLSAEKQEELSDEDYDTFSNMINLLGYFSHRDSSAKISGRKDKDTDSSWNLGNLPRVDIYGTVNQWALDKMVEELYNKVISMKKNDPNRRFASLVLFYSFLHLLSLEGYDYPEMYLLMLPLNEELSQATGGKAIYLKYVNPHKSSNNNIRIISLHSSPKEFIPVSPVSYLNALAGTNNTSLSLFLNKSTTTLFNPDDYFKNSQIKQYLETVGLSKKLYLVKSSLSTGNLLDITPSTHHGDDILIGFRREKELPDEDLRSICNCLTDIRDAFIKSSKEKFGFEPQVDFLVNTEGKTALNKIGIYCIEPNLPKSMIKNNGEALHIIPRARFKAGALKNLPQNCIVYIHVNFGHVAHVKDTDVQMFYSNILPQGESNIGTILESFIKILHNHKNEPTYHYNRYRNVMQDFIEGSDDIDRTYYRKLLKIINTNMDLKKTLDNKWSIVTSNVEKAVYTDITINIDNFNKGRYNNLVKEIVSSKNDIPEKSVVPEKSEVRPKRVIIRRKRNP